MKGIRLYLIILGLLAALSIYLLMSRRSGSIASSKHDFAVEDTGRIESVLISFAGEQVNLSRSGGDWMVNGARAKKESIRGLYVLISRLEVVAPVSRSMEDRIMEGFEECSTMVRILMEDGREKAYRVLYDSLSRSTFMMIESADIAFRVRVRGYRQTNLEELFPANARYWRDNVIFHHLPGEIQAVFLQNNIAPDKSFHLARNASGDFDIASGLVPVSWSPSNKESVAQYLGYFYNVRFESYLDPASDTFEHAKEPAYILNLELVSGKRSVVEFYLVYRTAEGGEREPDHNRLYARMGRSGDWILIRYIQIDPLLQEFEYFAGP